MRCIVVDALPWMSYTDTGTALDAVAWFGVLMLVSHPLTASRMRYQVDSTSLVLLSTQPR